MATPVFRLRQIREDIRRAGCAGKPGPLLAIRGQVGNRAVAKPSYVDESLFGRKAGRESMVVEFDPPWVDNKTKLRWWSPDLSRNVNNAAKPAVGTGASRKKSKYRLKSHKPSYCDESLFGKKPGIQEWTTTDIWLTPLDLAKIHPLLLTPPSAPKDRPVLSSRPKEIQLRAVHREAWGAEKSAAKHGQETQKTPENNSDLDNQRRARSQSLTQIHSSSDRYRPSVIRPWTCQPQEGRVRMTSTGSLSRLCPKGASEMSVQKSKSACKPRPPWK